MATRLTSAQAMDAAFAGRACHLVLADGTRRPVRSERWSGTADASDVALFVDPCLGPTLDIGCGPGRLTAALTSRGVAALGIDTSVEAVRQAKLRGAAALHHDVFADLPVPGVWRHVLLADGNIGIGGSPTRLLERVARLLSREGTALVELARPGTSAVHAGVRLHVGGAQTSPFTWATVGADAIAELADTVGLAVTEVRRQAGRYVAALRHHHEPGAAAR